MSMNGISNTYIPNTLSGLESLNATNITINGVDISTLYVPFQGSLSAVDLGGQRIQTSYVPTTGNDLTNKSFTDGKYVRYTGSTDAVDLGSNAIRTTRAPTAGSDLTNKTYVDGQDALRIPYTGASGSIQLGTNQIQTSYTPTTGNDLINKTYGDATYASATSLANYLPLSVPLGGVSVGGYAITWNNTMEFNTIVKFLYAPAGTVVSGLGIDSTGSVISYTAGNASLTGGTSGSYQFWSGWNQFANTTKINSLQITGSILAVTGTPTYLAVDSTGQVGFATPTINQTNVSGGATNYFIIGNSNNSTGAFIPSVSTSFYWNNSTGLTTTGLNVFGTVSLPPNGVSFSSTPNSGSSTTILALDGTNKIITTTISTAVPTQINPTLTTALTSYYPAFFQTNTVGAKTVYTEGNGFLTYTPSSTGGTLGTPTLLTANIYNSGAPLVLEGRGSGAPVNIFSTSTINLNIGTTSSFSTYGSITTSGISTTALSANSVVGTTSVNTPTLTSGANLVINPVSGTTTIKANGVDLMQLNTGGFTFYYLGNFYLTLSNASGTSADFTTPIGTDIKLNSLGSLIKFSINSTDYATVSSSGLSTNTINGFTSNGLTLNGKNATGTTAFQNNGNTVLTIGSTLTSSVYYQYFDIYSSSSFYNFKIAGTSFMTLGNNGMSLNGTASLLYVASVSSNAALQLNATTGNNINLSINSSNIAIVTSSGLYVNGTTSVCNGNYFQGGDSNSQMVMPYSTVKNIFIQNTNTVYGSAIASSGNWNSGNYTVFTNSTSRSGTTAGLGVWGGVGGAGICSLSPQISWQGLFLIGGPIYAYNTSVLGSTLTSTGWVNSSDRRFKKNIRPIKTTRSLERVLAVRPVTYNMIYDETQCPVSDALKNQQCLGFIAQEIAETNPHCIHEVDDATSKEKRFALQYNDYVVHLCGSVQEQQKQIEQQHKKIEEQSITINQLNQSLSQLIEHVATLTTAFNDLKKNSV